MADGHLMRDGFLKKLDSDSISGPALILIIATIAGGGCNFLFQIMMQNTIPNQISELNTLLSILYIISVPAGAVQNVVVKFVSKYKAENNDDAISYIMRRTFILVAGLGAAIGIVTSFILCTDTIRGALKLTSTTAIALIGAAIFFSLLQPVGSGALQGFQKFTKYGTQSMMNYALKLIVGFGAVLAGYGVAGAIGGVITGIAFASILSLFLVKDHLLNKGTPVKTNEIWRSTVPSMVGMLCYTILTNVDIIFGAILFDKDPANYYTSASTLAKVALFLPTAVVGAMYPKIARAYEEGRDPNPILKRSLAMMLVLSLSVCAVYVIAPEFILNVLVRGVYPLEETAPLMRTLAIAMLFIGLGNIFMYYGLAVNAHTHIMIMGLSVAVLIGAIAFLSIAGIAITPYMLSIIMIIVGALNASLCVIALKLSKRKMRPMSLR